MTKGKDYEVGYGKPPKHSQFPPGRSGNPGGRKAGARGLKTDLIAELDATDAFQVNGNPVKGTNQRLMIKTLAARAARGDIKAATLLLPLILTILGSEDRGGGRPKMSANDQAILDEVLGAFSSPAPDDPQVMLPPPEATDSSDEDRSGNDGIEGGKVPRRAPDDPHAVLRALLREDFGAFMRKCFPTICGGDLIAWNWHLDAIVHALNQVHEGSSRRLLVTMPPRNLKSIAISVAWVAWMLGQDPRRNFIVVTYADNLTGKHARDCLAIMQSAWYRELFPRTIISAKRSASGDFETTQGGGRLATTVTGTLTGRGGDFIVIDDPIKPEEAYSATTRDFVNQWYQSTLASRLNDKATGAIICVMQRLHQHDLAGMLLEAGGWDALSLPAIATLDEIIVLPRGRVHHRRENDVLHPERESRAVLDDQKKTMGSYAFEAQYQQDPISPKGGIIQFEWLKAYPPTFVPARPGQIVASWDTASKDGLNNDYSVCVIGHVRGREVRVLEVFRERLIFPELKRHVVRLAAEYKVDVLLVEDAASGQQLIQTLRSEQPPGVPLPIARRPELDKTSRMYGVSGQIEAGALMLPEDASWLGEFVREIIGFPGCRYNDQADALTQLMNWVLQSYNANNVSMPEGPISGYLDEHGNVRWSDGSSSTPTDPDFDPWSGLD